jgi:Rad3-related DNA helicase
MAGALQRCAKSVFLTSTKGLQDQLVRDFGDIGLTEIRGRGNYLCTRGDGPTAEDGLCRYGSHCEYKTGGCPYYDAVKRASQARYVVTNYAMWLSSCEFLNNAQVLVMDEAHNASEHLDNYLETEIDLEEISEVLEYGLSPPKNWQEWVTWLKPQVSELVKEGLKTVDMSLKRLRRLIKVDRALEALARVTGSPAIISEKIGHIYRISPVYLNQFAEAALFRGINNILLTSATMTEHTAQILGIKDYAYKEFPSMFPLAHRPIIYLPTVKMDRHATRAEEMLWLSRIEAILKGRMDRKGIIHSVSYERAKMIAKSASRAIMVHGSKNTAIAVRKFKYSKPPTVLVSPAMTTGWDFPYEECEFQIIAKVPFPDTRSQIQQVRSLIDPDLPKYKAWQGIVQAAGRGVRAEDDRCETIIIDNNFSWLNGRYGHLAPRWFRQAIVKANILPSPPEKLNGRRR